MTKSFNKKREYAPSNLEDNIYGPEVKKAKVSEQLSDKLPTDGLSPLD